MCIHIYIYIYICICICLCIRYKNSRGCFDFACDRCRHGNAKRYKFGCHFFLLHVGNNYIYIYIYRERERERDFLFVLFSFFAPRAQADVNYGFVPPLPVPKVPHKIVRTYGRADA